MHQIIKILTGEFAGQEATLKTWGFGGDDAKFCIWPREHDRTQEHIMVLNGRAEDLHKKGKNMEARVGMYVKGTLQLVSVEYSVIFQVER